MWTDIWNHSITVGNAVMFVGGILTYQAIKAYIRRGK